MTKSETAENPFTLIESSISKEKVGKQFLFDTTFTSLEGNNINFTNLNRNTFLYFGMYGCHPCMQELPALIELAKEHPEMNFIYATYDNPKIIEIERSEIFQKEVIFPDNFNVISINRAFMDKNKMMLGYPCRYFLDKNGTVLFFNFGGRVFNSNVTAQKKAMLASIIEVYNK
jgi:thiol-disulfide isomerase/thioredoxin